MARTAARREPDIRACQPLAVPSEWSGIVAERTDGTVGSDKQFRSAQVCAAARRPFVLAGTVICTLLMAGDAHACPALQRPIGCSQPGVCRASDSQRAALKRLDELGATKPPG